MSDSPSVKTSRSSSPTSTRMSTKGQLIIPKSIRDHYGWRAGSRLIVEDLGDGVRLRSADIPETTLDDLIGCADYEGPRRSLEEMEEAIARGARDRR